MQTLNSFNYDLLDDEDDLEYAGIKPVCKYEKSGYCTKIFTLCEYKKRIWTNPDYDKYNKSRLINAFCCMLAL